MAFSEEAWQMGLLESVIYTFAEFEAPCIDDYFNNRYLLSDALFLTTITVICTAERRSM